MDYCNILYYIPIGIIYGYRKNGVRGREASKLTALGEIWQNIFSEVVTGDRKSDQQAYGLDAGKKKCNTPLAQQTKNML